MRDCWVCVPIGPKNDLPQLPRNPLFVVSNQIKFEKMNVRNACQYLNLLRAFFKTKFLEVNL